MLGLPIYYQPLFSGRFCALFQPSGGIFYSCMNCHVKCEKVHDKNAHDNNCKSIFNIQSSTWSVIPPQNSWHYTFNKRQGKSKVPMNLYDYKDAVAVGVGLSLGENRATAARSGHLWVLHLYPVVCCVSYGGLWWGLLQTAHMFSKSKVMSVSVEQPCTREFQKYHCNKM